MGTTVKVNLPIANILKNHGLQKGGRVQAVMTSEVHRLSLPYIPFDNNPLSTTVDIEAESITYKMPYAQYQWYGKVMVGNPRQATQENLNYQGSPMRGAFWTNRAMANHKDELIKSIEDEIKKGGQ